VAEERLEVTKDDLVQAEKRLDRSKSITLGYWTHPGSNLFGSSTTSESDKVIFNIIFRILKLFHINSDRLFNSNSQVIIIAKQKKI
jgi:hypothetical protein